MEHTADPGERLLEQIDSVYFLLFPGWQQELRGNRWHFAVRWAKRKPVVLVNPINLRGGALSAPEPRIPNCRILDVQMVSEPNQFGKRHIQTAQVMSDLQAHGHVRPLLWCYNPDLVELYARVPAAGRLYHASENYFEMPGLSAAFHQQLRATIAVSDLTVAVSSGVADGLHRRVVHADVVTVTNGCDYAHYSGGRPDERLVEEGRAFERIAVYAGNINPRLDFELLQRLAEANPKVLFALYGPVKNLDPAESDAWRRFVAMSNVIAPGPVDPDRIRDLYAAGDVGIIPYHDYPWLVENGLPLKALEMGATGLPVVSTSMKALIGMARAIAVTTGADEFLSAFAATSRASLGGAATSELRAVSIANDYDRKFGQVLENLSNRIATAQPATRVDRMIPVIGDEYVADELRFARWLAMPLGLRVGGWFIGEFARLFPTNVRLWLGRTRLRQRLRELLGS